MIQQQQSRPQRRPRLCTLFHPLLRGEILNISPLVDR